MNSSTGIQLLLVISFIYGSCNAFSISANDDNATNIATTEPPAIHQQTTLDCKNDEFRCLTSMECIPKWWRCDHIIDCQDGSDEWQQSDFNLFDYQLVDEETLRSFDHRPLWTDDHASNPLASLNNLLKEYSCKPCNNELMFRCETSGECIPRGWLCDGQLDCGSKKEDQSDEENDFCKSIQEIKLNWIQFNSSLTSSQNFQPLILMYNHTHIHSSIQMSDNSNSSSKLESIKTQLLMKKLAPGNVAGKKHSSKIFTINNSMICRLDHQTSLLNCYPVLNGGTTFVNKLPHFINAESIDKIQFNSQTNQFYLLDRTNEIVYECDYDLQHCSVAIDHQILSRPLDFVIDSKQNLLFISRLGDRSRGSNYNLTPVILKVKLNQQNLSAIEPVVDIGIIEAKHLAVDIEIQRLYWIDTRLNSLEYVDYNGKNRHRLKISTTRSSMLNGNSIWPNSVTTIMHANDNHLYLLWTSNTITTNKTNGTTSTIRTSQVSTIVIHNNHFIMRQTYRSNNELVNATIIFVPTTTITTAATISIDNNQQQANSVERQANDEKLINCSPKSSFTRTSNTNNVLIGQPLLIYSRLDPGLIKFRALNSMAPLVDTTNEDDDDEQHQPNDHTKQYQQGQTATLPPITFSRSPTTFDIDPFAKKIYYLDDYDTNLLFNNIDVSMFAADFVERTNNTKNLSTPPPPSPTTTKSHHCQRNLIKQQQAPTTKTKRIDLKYFGTIDRSIESISFDWCNKNVYFLERKGISVMKLVDSEHAEQHDTPTGNNPPTVVVNENHETIWKKMLITNLIEPTALALDPERAVMFFADTTVAHQQSQQQQQQQEPYDEMTSSPLLTISYTIKKSSMDGSIVETLIELDDEKTPSSSYTNAITLDSDNQHLYWCDTTEKSINRINYDGTGSVRLLQSSRVNVAKSLFYYDQSIYWTELQHGIIQRFDLQTNQTSLLLKERAPLFQMKMAIFQNESDLAKQKCFINQMKVQCDQFTLLSPSGDGQVNSVCSCDDHYRMDGSNPGKCIQLTVDELSSKFCNKQKEIYMINGRRCISIAKYKIRQAKQPTTLDKASIPAGLLLPNTDIIVVDEEEDVEEGEEEDDDEMDGNNLLFAHSSSIGSKRKTKKKQCQEKEFSCDQGRRCIPYNWLCDGHKDCHDQTDEKKICQSISPKLHYRCPDGYFQCLNRPLCIPQHWRCDQEYDCGHDDPSDEDQCK